MEQNPENRKSASDADLHVGAMIRLRRIEIGMSQEKLAELIGVSYQQAAKYERGINRVSAGKLYVIAKALGVEVQSFYDGIDEATPAGIDYALTSRVNLETIRDLMSVPDEQAAHLRASIKSCAKAYAATSEGAAA
jgi:transcriptional regulator with XRE-family HTH domain